MFIYQKVTLKRLSGPINNRLYIYLIMIGLLESEVGRSQGTAILIFCRGAQKPGGENVTEQLESRVSPYSSRLQIEEYINHLIESVSAASNY